MIKPPPEPKMGKACPKSLTGYHQWVLAEATLNKLSRPAESLWVCSKCGVIKRVRAPGIIHEGFPKK